MILAHLRIFLVGIALFMAATMVAARYLPVKYSATALFERRGDSAVDLITSNNRNESFQTMRLTLQQELADPRVVEEVLVDLGVARAEPDGQGSPEAQAEQRELVGRILKNIKIEWKVRSDQLDLIAVTMTSPDPRLAEAIPNALVNRYITFASGKILERLKASREFLRKQVEICSRRQTELMKKKIEFESKYDELALTGTANINGRVQELYSDLETFRRQHNLSVQKVQQTKSLIRMARLKALRDRREQLNDEVDACLSLHQMTEAHPKVQALRARIAQIEARIRNGEKDDLVMGGPEKDVIDPNLMLQLAAAEADVQANKNETERIQKRLATYKALMSGSVPLREEYLNICKPLEQQEAETKRWQQRLTEVEMTIAAEDANRRTQLRKVQLAQRPTAPIFPPAWAVIVGAVGGGLLFGYGLVLLANGMDHSLHQPEEATRLFNLPVLGVVSTIETSRRWGRTAAGIVMLIGLTAVLGLTSGEMMKRLGYGARVAQRPAPAASADLRVPAGPPPATPVHAE